MSSRQGHECYTDNIKVKISERFKPPPRINVAVPYTQRLAITQQIQDNMPNYEFNLERTVLKRMVEWKNYRRSVSEERRARLEKARDQMKELESAEEQLDEIELKTVTESDTTAYSNNNFIPMPSNEPIGTSIAQNYLSYSTCNSILVPTQASNHYSNILTPIPLQTNGSQQQYSCKQNDKSPFNISDFENDTSSPFDNMELKSINDMEELAQVLNKGKNFSSNLPVYSNYQHQPVQASSSQIPPSYSSYYNNQYSYNIPNCLSYVQPTNYTQRNGYYYSQPGQQFQSPCYFPKPSTTDTTPIQSPPNKSSCKSVPDIVKALESELQQMHVGTSAPKESFIRTNLHSETSRPKSNDPMYPRPKIKVDQLDDPFNLLTRNQQDVCEAISSMGFPLSRVARTCKIFGDDQKKMVEHLLALSDLLDLGFSEKDVSSVLVECDNDRDKALDKLIS